MLTKEEKTALKNQCEKMTKNPKHWENDNFYEPLWNKIARDIKDNNFSLEEVTSFATIDKATLNGNNIILQNENLKIRFNTENKTLEAKQNNKKYIDVDIFIKKTLKSKTKNYDKTLKTLKTTYYLGGIINIMYYQCQGLYINTFAYDAYKHIK